MTLYEMLYRILPFHSPHKSGPHQQMALAAEHMESKNRWNYRTFNSLDTIWEEILMKFAYDKSKAQRIINHEDIMLKTYSKIIVPIHHCLNNTIVLLKLDFFGLIFLPRSVLTVVCRFILVMHVMYVVKFRETAKKYK